MSILRDNVNEGPSALRKILKDGFAVAPGVIDGIAALQAQRAGFNSLYLSGSGVAGSMGLPDLSVTTLTEVADSVRRIVQVSKLPLIVDADTGFGEAINVTRTVRVLESAGASAIHIEDQVLPKKCGHLAGKVLVDPGEMILKIRAAVDARKNDDFVIIARTDARSVNGLSDAIERAKEYLENGADMIFTEALESKEEFAKFAREVKAPLLANMTEFGKSPLLTVGELRQIGYKAVIFPLTAFRASLLTTEAVFSFIAKNGTQAGIIDRLMTRADFYNLIGYDDYENEDSNLAARKYRKGKDQE
ncbi:MAG: methylisocitrate lyase [Candidatus Thermoplasmatota archaeon]|jgi:methylisocitrate lyase|nr:methylisocitrate lyase [Candidatus Thermoplasmatota archaeon]